MAIVRMQKVAILARRTLRDPFIEALHEEGMVQVIDAREEAPVDHSETNFRIAELQFAITTLSDIAPKDVLSQLHRKRSPQEIIHMANATDVRGIVDALHALEVSDTEAERVLQEQRTLAEMLAPWEPLAVPLDLPAESALTIRVLGTMPALQSDAFRQVLQRTLPRSAVEIVSVRESQAFVMAVVWKADLSRFEEIATTHGWTDVVLPPLAGTAADLRQEAIIHCKESEKTKEKNHRERVRLAAELPRLADVAQYVQWLTQKRGVREAMRESFAVVTLLGWMPAANVASLERKLQLLDPAVAVLPMQPAEGEEAPVLLRNSTLITPFTSVTTLYGLPLPSEMDPTPRLAPFFILFFALCLTDAGYGLTLTLIMGAYLAATKQSIQQAPLWWLLLFSGIVTFFVGIPFGGWFGLMPEQVPVWLTAVNAEGQRLFLGQIWNLGTQSGISFLQNLALALGLTHLFFGMFLSGWHKWVHGQKAAAFWLDFTSHLLFAAIAFAVAAPLFPATSHLQQAAMYGVYAAFALAIWGKGYGSPWYLRPIMGFLGLVNFAIGMLSNGLSYLRILALGLVTGAMAMAVNQVAVELGRLFPPWLGIPVVILIFLFGHIVSIALNTLGSFIHSGRLQFIEFFSQFFEGGGRPFQPFRRSTP